MRFPHPVAVTCLTCGQLTVMAETSTGVVRVHCGTWRWQCDTPRPSTEHEEGNAVAPLGLTALDASSDQNLAA